MDRLTMKAREVLKAIRKSGLCKQVRQKGSHIFIRCECNDTAATTVVPDHGRGDLGTGLLRSIEGDLEPCLGKKWLK